MLQIQVGYELVYELPQVTPMILALNIHYSRASDVVVADNVRTEPGVVTGGYRDPFGNWCTRLTAPAGTFKITANAVVNDAGPENLAWQDTPEHPVFSLPSDTLQFLLPSRYCESDLLQAEAWRLFSGVAPGWQRVQAVCDFVHRHIEFGYQYADSSKTAVGVFHKKKGVCRDFAHLAIAFCRALNIPARYCTGYISDLGLPPPYAPMDFSAWMEVYLGGAWYPFDPRNNAPRVGRILIAQGRDAADVAIATTFGQGTLTGFTVWCDEYAPPKL